jgi:hypothetical protein
MLSLTLRPTFQAELPKAARPACVHSLGQAKATGPLPGWYRIPAIHPQPSSLEATDRTFVDCNGQPDMEAFS